MVLSDEQKVKRDLAYAEYEKDTLILFTERGKKINKLNKTYWEEMKKMHDIYLKKRGLI